MNELIDALRYCAEHEGCDYYIAKDCPREDTWVCGADCEQILMIDAADALEAAEKRIKELESQAAFFDAEKLNYQENIEYRNERIKELEAQMPKEGKWIDANGADVPLDKDGDTTDSCYCSICGDWLTASDEYATRGRYCPNCGAKMHGETEHANTYSLGKIEMPKGAMKKIIADGERKDGDE